MLKTDTFGQGPNLTLLHGWAAQNSDWKSWAETELAPYFTVTLIELPGFGNSEALPDSQHIEADWIAAITDKLPTQTHLLGWSLGGLLAQKIAVESSERIQSLICLASTPRFTQSDDWKWGVSPSLIADFIQAIGSDTAATLKHFWKLQIQGSHGARQLIKEFMAKIQDSSLPSMKGLLQGLELLKSIDCRPCTQEIQCPVLWLLGENDPLIPVNFIQDFMAEFSTIQPTVKVEILSGAAHMPFLSHPTETAEKIIAFVQNQNP
ncbi:MAG: alpha/beta fold hydrolase [Thiomicrorhabdus sp.]|jgi:pimeloyl-[acyl-carrier protein] methyl ester esterase|nr:alpha/beta fold hydrolase [Thiomicrorhabdus sp.]